MRSLTNLLIASGIDVSHHKGEIDWEKIGTWTYWQYKNRGHIDGINGYVDLNVLRSPSSKSF